ncbi:hypothetical protein BH11MYX4_BH11MYX4_01910 [soil metagenome]
MSRRATGELRPLGNGWEARIRIAGKRVGFTLRAISTKDEEAARARCAAMADFAVRLRQAGEEGETEKVLEMAARARTGKAWDAVLVAVDALCREGGTSPLVASNAPTFVDFANDWAKGELHKKWPDHVPVKADHGRADDARVVKLYVEPIIGDLRIADFTLDHGDQIMAHLPDHLSPSSRRHVAQCVRRVLGLAVYPARHRAESPIPKGWLPKVKSTIAFTHLYPEEDRALLACTGTTESPGAALVRRLFFGVLAREGLRREELASLRWQDVDLDRGVIRLDVNKTDDPRAWALDAAVSRALVAWKSRYRSDAEPHEPIFGEKGCALYVEKMAEQLRTDLKRAGVEREALFERTAARRPIRVHDLRATFVTVSLANGKTETWVADRTGHRSSEMINRYRRAARTWSELNLGPLAPLDECIPELRSVPRQRPIASASHGPGKQPTPANDDESAVPLQATGTDSHSKSGVVKATKGSNPLLSASFTGVW